MTPHSLLAPGRLAGRQVLRTQSDERLIDLVRAGSDPAFEAIVARYRRALTRYCARILPDDRAEDAVQLSFVRAYEAMRATDAPLALRPWLFRIVHNTALNTLRDRGWGHEPLEDRVDGSEPPDERLERGQRLRDVLSAVQGLPERQRDAILLRELEGRSYAEIAQELGVSGGAVRQLINRARTNVRAAATAVTPAGLVERIAEAAAPTAVGTAAVKACAAVLITGAVVSGGAMAPDAGRSPRSPEREAGAAKVAGAGGPAAAAVVRARSAGSADRAAGTAARAGAADRHGAGHGADRERDSEGRDDSSTPGSGEPDERRSRSGPGSGDDTEHVTLSEPPDSDSSGPGSGSSGSGSSGSGTSGSGSSGSGSDSSGSGSSGSGSSGSGSSGSGSSGSGHDVVAVTEAD